MEDCCYPWRRLYAWIAYDGTLCVACCDCGKVITGEEDEDGD